MTALPALLSPTTPLFTVTVAARLAGMHPQTLRQYDRIGLVVAQRTRGRGRRYSLNDVHRLRLVQQLSQEEGINLQGIRRILALEDEIADLRRRLDDARELIDQVQHRGRGPRLFTADTSGSVDFGFGLRAPRALLPGRNASD